MGSRWRGWESPLPLEVQMVPVYSSTATNYSRDTYSSTAGTYSTNDCYVTQVAPYPNDDELELEEPRPSWPAPSVPRLKTCILPPKQMTRVSMMAWVRGRSSREHSHRVMRRVGADLRR